MHPLLSELSETDLKAVIAPFGEERTLPAAAYTSQAVFEWEMEELWNGGWVAIGRTADFPEGTATEVSNGAESLIVTNEGELRAFHNVCRHRGHEILEAGAQLTGRSMRCPYHGWLYGLDGSLRAAPKMHHRTDLDGVSLVDIGIDHWHGWVMMSSDPAAPPLDDYLDGLRRYLDPYDPAALVPAVRVSYEVAANWKLIHENYHECYHCPLIHPQLTAVANTDSGVNFTTDGAWVGGSLGFREGVTTLTADVEARGEPIPWLPEDLRSEAFYFGLVPNLLISPHPDYVLTHRLTALGPASTVIECEWLFPADVVAEPGFDPAYAIEFWDMTNRQDWAACESLQRGAASRGYRPGMLGAGEDAVYQFLGRMASAYLGEGLRPVPNPGRRL